MNNLSENFQIVCIDNFYDLDNTEGWMDKIFQFKKKSYLESFEYGICPFGKHDIFAKHYVLCLKDNDKTIPIMAFKVVNHLMCQKFNMSFPPYDLIENLKSTQYKHTLDYIVQKANQLNTPLYYLGSWAIDTNYRDNSEVKSVCKLASSALFYHWVQEDQVQMAITFANRRFKVEKIHQYLGMQDLKDPFGKALAPFPSQDFDNDPISPSIFYIENLSQAAIKDGKRFQELWENRLFLFNPEDAAKVA
jgi:hypothetical protein